MARTLLISGTLAPRAVHERMVSSEAGETTVVEFDSMHDRLRYPRVAAWHRLTDFIPLETALSINEEAENLTDTFLSHELPAGDLPTHRAFRAACLSAHTWRLAVPHLLNRHLARLTLRQIQPEQIIVSAGSGIHFEAWREVAEAVGIRILFIPPEKIPISLSRRLWKGWHRWRKPTPARLADTQPHADTSSEKSPALCTSERLSRLLAAQAKEMKITVQALTARDLKVTDAEAIKEMTHRYRQWWSNWQADQTEAIPSPVRNIGQYYVEKVYPVYACLYQQARQRLAAHRPPLILCDTQAGTPERMWSLAAQELGIPVVAYNYDHLPEPRFSFMPDFLLADSGRSAMTAITKGVPERRILSIQSHRKTTLRKHVSAQAPSSSLKRPLVIYADSYYAGTRADIDPGRSYHFYKLVIETARQLSEADFVIKFHPLRERKQEQLSFVAMDETELSLRTGFIHALRPPSNLRLIQPEENLPQYLAKADVLLNYNSTSGIEAFEMGIPVVFMQPVGPQVKAYPNIHDYQACLQAEDTESLVGTIQKLIHEPVMRTMQIEKQQRYLREFYWPPGPNLVEGIETCWQRIEASPK